MPKVTKKASGGKKDNNTGDKQPEGEGVFVVEKILDKKFCLRKAYYHVKWQGWDISESTWEPVENLHGCAKLLQDFETKATLGKKGKGGPGRGSGCLNRKRRKRAGVSKDEDDDEEEDEKKFAVKTPNARCFRVLEEWPADKDPISVEAVIYVGDELAYVVKKKTRLGGDKLNGSNAVVILAGAFKKWFPELVIKYYEERVIWAQVDEMNDEKSKVTAQINLLKINGFGNKSDYDESAGASHGVSEVGIKSEDDQNAGSTHGVSGFGNKSEDDQNVGLSRGDSSLESEQEQDSPNVTSSQSKAPNDNEGSAEGIQIHDLTSKVEESEQCPPFPGPMDDSEEDEDETQLNLHEDDEATDVNERNSVASEIEKGNSSEDEDEDAPESSTNNISINSVLTNETTDVGSAEEDGGGSSASSSRSRSPSFSLATVSLVGLDETDEEEEDIPNSD